MKFSTVNNGLWVPLFCPVLPLTITYFITFNTLPLRKYQGYYPYLLTPYYFLALTYTLITVIIYGNVRKLYFYPSLFTVNVCFLYLRQINMNMSSTTYTDRSMKCVSYDIISFVQKIWKATIFRPTIVRLRHRQPSFDGNVRSTEPRPRPCPLRERFGW